MDKPAPSDKPMAERPAPAKAEPDPLDALEEEMAKLLGRPPAEGR